MSRFAVIMAGGSGTRFWPRSSQKQPKQFLSLTGKKSMLQTSFDRLDGVVDKKKRWVVSTRLLSKAVKKQIGNVPLLAEPEGRNTMAAVSWSVWDIHKKDPHATVAVLPADAFVKNEKAYREALSAAFEVAEKENLIVCLGIKPTGPATGYGYIESGDALATAGCELKRFVEKPSLQKAQEYFQSGHYLWNAGIFVFKTAVFIGEAMKHAPQFAKAFDDLKKNPKRLNSIYKTLPKEPVDVALMEKTSRGAVIPGDFGWNDVGSWEALADVLPATSSAGVIRAPGGHAAVESHGMIVDVSSKKFIGLVGVKDLVVVETDKALLICSKTHTQDIKKLVGLIESDKSLKKRLL